MQPGYAGRSQARINAEWRQKLQKKGIIKMTTRTLKNHEYAQAHVEIENDGDSIIYRLVSYKTHVATVNETAAGGWFLECYGLYSMTTRRHIGWFLDDIGSPFTFQDAKHSAQTGTIVCVIV